MEPAPLMISQQSHLETTQMPTSDRMGWKGRFMHVWAFLQGEGVWTPSQKCLGRQLTRLPVEKSLLKPDQPGGAKRGVSGANSAQSLHWMFLSGS